LLDNENEICDLYKIKNDLENNLKQKEEEFSQYQNLTDEKIMELQNYQIKIELKWKEKEIELESIYRQKEIDLKLKEKNARLDAIY